MEHENLHKLTAWVKSTGTLYIKVSFYPQNQTMIGGADNQWAIRLCSNGWRGMNSPLRTLHGDSLELIATQMLPLAQEKWAQMKEKLIAESKEADKRRVRQTRQYFREIEAMHHTAGDF
jgi:hypothetical protein